MRSSKNLDALGQGAVASDPAVVVAVGADELGEHLGVTRIGLRPREGVAVPVARRGPRVDRVHLIAGLDQRLDPQAPIGLDPDHDDAGVLAEGADQLMQGRHALDAFG
jgi:hypothetical protein